MKNAQFRFVFVLFGFLILFSCKKDDVAPACSGAWATELSNEITAIGTAVSIYSTDPSDANCNSMKAAYQDYIDGLRSYGNCSALTGTSRSDWQQAIDDAESSLDDFC